jgi:hypothetical protein
MLYLVRPDLTVGWSDFPVRTSSLFDRAATDPGFDLADLTWKPADHPASRNVVRLALRHGVACREGIVVDAIVLINERRPRELAQGLHDVNEAKKKLVAEDDIMEQLMPGWKAHGKEVDGQVNDAMGESIAEAQEDADVLLAAPVKDELLTAWTSLGGAVYESGTQGEDETR